MTILVTGASGFIGSYICEEGQRRGFDVWAGMRKSSSRKYLTAHALRFAMLDLADPQTLRNQLNTYKQQLGGKGWDYVVHAAGATKCLRRADFFENNTKGTRNLVEALIEVGMMPRMFVFISSLSVFGAIREKARKGVNEHIYSPILSSDTPHPNTAYGESKLEAECFLATVEGLPYIILRPTGVYGPRERDYFMMAKSIKQHIDFAVGYKPQEITFVYVSDVVQAVFKALQCKEAVGKAYFLSDGRVYGSRQFSDLLQKELGITWVLHIKAPLWLLWLICAVNGMVNRWMGKLTTLNLDKYHILSQRNWQCDIEPARHDLGYDPEYDLERGVHDAVAWYRKEGWL